MIVICCCGIVVKIIVLCRWQVLSYVDIRVTLVASRRHATKIASDKYFKKHSGMPLGIVT